MKFVSNFVKGVEVITTPVINVAYTVVSPVTSELKARDIHPVTWLREHRDVSARRRFKQFRVNQAVRKERLDTKVKILGTSAKVLRVPFKDGDFIYEPGQLVLTTPETHIKLFYEGLSPSTNEPVWRCEPELIEA